MGNILNCPTCGGGLEWDGAAPVVECRYCGANVVTNKKEKEPPRVQIHVHGSPELYGPTPSGRAIPLAVAAGALVIGVAAVSFFVAQEPPRDGGASQPATVSDPKHAAKETPEVPLSRLSRIVVDTELDEAKPHVATHLPDAEVDVHGKTFTVALRGERFKEASFAWQWGCQCLEHVLLTFTDWKARKASDDDMVPCLIEALGDPSGSNPPHQYTWEADGGRPRVQLNQVLRIDFDTSTQRQWAGLVEDLDRCARSKR